MTLLDEFLSREKAAKRRAAAFDRATSIADELRRVDAEMTAHIEEARSRLVALKIAGLLDADGLTEKADCRVQTCGRKSA